MKRFILTEEQLKEIVTQAHMQGQMYDGCAHPSFGDAFAYFSINVLKNLPNELQSVSNNENTQEKREHEYHECNGRFSQIPRCIHCGKPK